MVNTNVLHMDDDKLLIFIQGAFVNVAYFEQFGVTLIEVRTLFILINCYYSFVILQCPKCNRFVNCYTYEQAAMNGLPVIATKNGAPVEIHQVCLL
jgi:sucrose-phosphate synthase